MRLNRGKAVPAADGHHHTRVHLFTDEQALGEPAAEIMGTHFLEVRITGHLRRPGSCPSNHSPDPWLRQIDEGVFRRDVVLVLEALEVSLDVGGKESIARPPTVAAGIFPGLDAESVLSAVGLLDVDGADLWNLECTEADERTSWMMRSSRWLLVAHRRSSISPSSPSASISTSSSTASSASWREL